MPQHVLVPLDGSDHGFAGLEYSLESFPDASITALSVVDPTHDHTATVGSSESPMERAEAQRDAVLERAIDRAGDHGREIRTLGRTGRPHTEILTVVTDEDIDHVVLGSHGESPITSPFLGHVSEAVLRRSPVSTTIVPESTAALRDRELPGPILVPVDGSEQAEAALEYALETFPGGSHTAFHVLELPFDRSPEAVEGTYLEEVRADYEDRAEEVLESATARADEREASIETATTSGTPAEEIIDYAVANGYAQIVMGSHGRSLPSRLITGSVAERVARRSPRTVTLIRGTPTMD
ncbi:Nucleotide-binding universal stress protein, UspA family [Halobiforma haloterrestris]|uniref:Nucleotide-binding universal stress protein, UspA family n=1 Tax=Natronobacterium haloterrestre TaxID=148448 RepID=A0A1I1KKJ4_NATHA|nr:universal stress protein [Halobiforma haloterrestris]SFC61396.1 Nucleotide-binding universal stress protein, UspA family [Halobiforma haloterrestris]